MTARLLNAAVMPRPGRYDLQPLAPQQFAQRVRALRPVSYIGYPAAAAMLESLCGLPVPVCRESTPVEDGDILLVARLRYRVGNPAAKGHVVAGVDDYEFFECLYCEAPR
jgi:hypothetical protein